MTVPAVPASDLACRPPRERQRAGAKAKESKQALQVAQGQREPGSAPTAASALGPGQGGGHRGGFLVQFQNGLSIP